MASFKTRQHEAFEELGITRDELNQIGEAFKKEEFRKLFSDYVDEITDPENQKKFESEITELERERGNDVTFIHPRPGYVIKTSADGEKKSFINVCCNDNIGKPSAIPAAGGLRWSLPYIQAPPREDLDKKKNLCLVFDVVFHPDTIQMTKENNKFKEMVTETAVNAVEDSYKVKLDKQNIRYPAIQFKGMKKPTIIRKRSKNPPLLSDSEEGGFEIPNYPYPPINEEHNVNIKEIEVPVSLKKVADYTTPKYVLKQRKNVDMQECTNSMTSKMNSAIPNELVIVIELPLIKSSSDVNLDVTEKSLKLISEKPARYKLDITLPYSVDEDKGTATFDVVTKRLTVTLVVKCIKGVQNVFEAAREDSGVDSDMGSCSRSAESSSEEEPLRDQDKSPVIQEEVSNNASCSDAGYRTNSECDEFLSSEKHYSLPLYNFNVLENTLAFTLHVQNVEPDSVESRNLDDNSGFHLKFTSIGTGFFPIHYAFCVKFPTGISINNDNLDVEVWDNNIIAQVSLQTCDKEIYEYFCGVSEKSLEKFALPNPLKLQENIQKETENSINPSSTTKIEVVKFEEDNVVFEITNDESSLKRSGDEHEEFKSEATVETALEGEIEPQNEKESDDAVKGQVVEEIEFKSEVQDEIKKMNNGKVHKNVKIGRSSDDFRKSSEKKSPRSMARTMSESHSRKSEPKPYRGILKTGRSLSESSADDYHWSSSSVESSDPNAANVEKTKKTVRFNDLISKKMFRSNSSILGQKKKNQRKARNKKRAQERRASESENSEGEPDERKYTNSGTVKSDIESSESQSDVSHSDISQSDISQSDISESDDGMKPDYKPDVMSLSKRNPHKRGGKKSARKSANTAKMTFPNCQVFDLDDY